MKRFLFTICCSILFGAVLNAQWLHQPTRGVPRQADGAPNWSASAPKSADGHPDLSGIWRIIPNPYGADLTQQLKVEEIQPWARELRQQRVDQFQSATMSCLPLGPLNSTGTASFGEGVKFIQTPAVIVMLYGDLTYRQVFLDGRSLEKHPNPAWMGYSVGHWDGDSLVVESNGYNDRTWLDFVGLPHSEGLRITERFQRTNFGSMILNMTVEDPAVYPRPIHLDTAMQAMVDTEIMRPLLTVVGHRSLGRLRRLVFGVINITGGGSATLNLVLYASGVDFLMTGNDSIYNYSGGGNAQPNGCSASALSGVYAFTGTGFILSAGSVSGVGNATGLLQFDGQGNITVNLTQSQSGKAATPLTLTGSYSISSNCLGSATLSDLPKANSYVMGLSITSATALYSANLDATLAQNGKSILTGAAHAIYGQPTATPTDRVSIESGDGF